MSPTACFDLCSQKGYKFAGFQYYSYCLCGNKFGTYGTATTCNTPCHADSTSICGGAWTNTVYELPKSQEVTTYKVKYT
jgi:hypothetical protein